MRDRQQGKGRTLEMRRRLHACTSIGASGSVVHAGACSVRPCRYWPARACDGPASPGTSSKAVHKAACPTCHVACRLALRVMGAPSSAAASLPGETLSRWCSARNNNKSYESTGLDQRRNHIAFNSLQSKDPETEYDKLDQELGGGSRSKPLRTGGAGSLSVIIHLGT
jgi:hypothetical protein